jgi:acetyltransferase-like isoleucine patch superfamily enzyme
VDEWARELRSKLTGAMWRWQLAFLRLQGAEIHRTVRAFGRVRYVGDARNLHIGPDSTLNEGVFLNLRDRVTIGADVHVSPYAQLHTGRLNIEDVPRRHEAGGIVVEDHVWIASSAIVSAGVRIGRAAVVAAGAVVTADVPAATLVAGIPARPVRSIDLREEAPHP